MKGNDARVLISFSFTSILDFLSSFFFDSVSPLLIHFTFLIIFHLHIHFKFTNSYFSRDNYVWWQPLVGAQAQIFDLHQTVSLKMNLKFKNVKFKKNENVKWNRAQHDSSFSWGPWWAHTTVCQEKENVLICARSFLLFK